jgi:hypothetical protein
MSKIKMRCTVCGKWFQSANAKETTCSDCVQKARKDKLAAKNAPSTPSPTASGAGTTRPVAPPKPKTVHSGTNQWLDALNDVKVAQPEPPPVRPKLAGPPNQRNGQSAAAQLTPGSTNPSPTNRREAQPYHVPGSVGQVPAPGQRPPYLRQAGEAALAPRAPYNPKERRGDPVSIRPKPKPKVVQASPKPKREKTPPPPPFVPTEEQVKQVEERYLELAQPAEFDGIRTQIAQEIGIPKKAVKQIIKDLRARQSIPSWWELQSYKGNSEEFEKIKAAYLPYLPLPSIGIHKKIAEELAMKAGIVYQAIKAVRQELNLPQFNDPSLHTEELNNLNGQIKPVLETAPIHQMSNETVQPLKPDHPMVTENMTELAENNVAGT